MGTLFHQEPRRPLRFCNPKGCTDHHKIVDFINVVKETSKEYGLTIDQTLKVMEILSNERRNNLYYENGDIHDEQMAGMGEIFQNGFQQLSDSIGELEKTIFTNS